MAHKKTSDQISYNMRQVKNKNTTIELRLENELRSRESQILLFLQEKLLYFVMAISGMATIGRKNKKPFTVTVTFGFQRLKKIWSMMQW